MDNFALPCYGSGIYYPYYPYINKMWIRKIGSSGPARVVVLPQAMLRALGWRLGDHLSISVIGDGMIVLVKVEESRLSDSQIAAAREVKIT